MNLALTLVLAVLGAIALPAHAQAPAGNGKPTVSDIGRQMICRCGDCGNATFDQCAPGCPNALKIKPEIAAQLSQGKSQEEILNHFADKYGEQMLGNPRPRGLAATALPIPVIAVLCGLLPLTLLLRSKRRRQDPAQPATAAKPGSPAPDDPRVAEALRDFDY